jgi:hypothetical protein
VKWGYLRTKYSGRIFGYERGGGKVNKEELHNVCSSSSISRLMRSRRMKWEDM